LSLARALAREARKPRSQRGTHTAARELRRFFLLTGLLTQVHDRHMLTEYASAILEAAEGGEPHTQVSLWRQALLNMPLTDADGRTSHPYRVLLQLLESRPGIQKPKLALALEATDDSEPELRRIIDLADRPDWEQVLRSINVTAVSAANAVKILPALALQLDDMVQEGEQCFPSAAGPRHGQLAVAAALGTRATTPPRQTTRRHRVVTADQIAPAHTQGQAPDHGADEALAALAYAAELRRERTDRHQQLVRRLARSLQSAGYALQENPFDCLATQAGSDAMLIEAKTIDGDPADERAQVTAALAQLQYYCHFDLPPEVDRRRVRLIALFEGPISHGHVEFLIQQGVMPLWVSNAGFDGPQQSRALLDELR